MLWYTYKRTILACSADLLVHPFSDQHHCMSSSLQNLLKHTDLNHDTTSGLKVIKLFSSSTQLSMKFIMPLNVKMPTILGILTFISMINTATECFKARKVFNFHHFSFNEHLKFHAQQS